MPASEEHQQPSEPAQASQPDRPTSHHEHLESIPPVGTVLTNDGVVLKYEKYGHSGPTVVLIHGWSGSRHYYDLNTRPISRSCTVFTYDLRHHGESGKPTWGFHVARLAADLRDILVTLDLTDVTVVGSSMGAAIIWSYLELYGPDRVSQAVFVDQAPLQNIKQDWKSGSTGCYDTASLTRLQCRLIADFQGFAKDNAKFCVSKPIANEVMQVLESETLKANPHALAELMADHTALDWRPLLQRITIPCLNIVGRHSQVFPWWGCEATGTLVPNCHTVFFENCNHWLYIEEPAQFNSIVSTFAQSGIPGVTQLLGVTTPRPGSGGVVLQT